jgi:chromate reductase, NAD(P)H dehydrogenase (quinone)
VRPLRASDAGEALTVQRAAFLAEGDRYATTRIPPLTETLDDVRSAIAANVVLGAFDGPRLVGSARLTIEPSEELPDGSGGQTVIGWVSRVAVAPDQQGRGIATRLIDVLERRTPTRVAEYRLWTGARSDDNIRLYERLGYRRLAGTGKDAADTDVVELVKTRPSNILLLSGSLRERSVNTAVLRTVAALAPSDVRTVLWSGTESLPHYRPDLPDDDVALVDELRSAVGAADAVLISTPEYAGGLPGSFKNVLDWLIGGVELNERKVSWIATSVGPTAGADAHASLRIVLRYAGAHVLDSACVTLPLPHTAVGEDGLIADASARSVLAAVVPSLLVAASA